MKLTGKIKSLMIQVECDKQRVANAERALQDEFNNLFHKNVKLNAAIKSLESSNEYGTDERGIYQWIRFVPDFDMALLPFLEGYLSEVHQVNFDADNDALTNYVGPSIIINDEGDVLDEDSGKWILSADEYTSQAECKRKIKAYMDKTGYFPGVFRYLDQYGTVALVSIDY